MNGALVRICKQVIVADLKVLFRHSLEDIEESHGKFYENCLSYVVIHYTHSGNGKLLHGL